MRNLTIALLLVGASLVQADTPAPVWRTRPLILHLAGTMAADRTAAARIGFTTVSFAVKGREPDLRRWLGVEDVYPLGDYPRLGKDILDDVHMYEPTFFVVGAPDLVARFLAVAPGTHVVLEALTNLSSRTFYLRRVEAAEGH